MVVDGGEGKERLLDFFLKRWLVCSSEATALIFDFSVESKQLLKEEDLLLGRLGREEGASEQRGKEAGRRGAAKRKESGNKDPSHP